MKVRLLSLATVVCALFLAVGVDAKETRRPDAWITTKVKTTLATHKNVSAIGTNVETNNGVVTLRGEVNSAVEKELTSRYVGEVLGVAGINNQLVVKGEDFMRYAGDPGLSGRVKSALSSQSETRAFQTEVDPYRGSVMLSGTAKNRADSELAEEIARDVTGVRSVNNRIEIR